MSEPHKQRPSATGIVTNLTKLGGLLVGANETLLGQGRGLVIGLAALMIAGGEVAEALVLALFDRIFGRAEEAPREGP